MKHDVTLTPLEVLKNVLDYYADEGTFIWKRTLNRGIVAGVRAGSFKDGQYLIGFQGKKYPAAEIALFLHTGRVPEFPVKFRDGNPQNLKYSNLYEDVIW